jgi:cell division protein FtsB
MKAVKYLIALWVGVAVYVVTSILWGGAGFSAYNQLLEEGEKLQANMARLRQINRELESGRDALLYDRETLGLRARELGYAAPGEQGARIVGLSMSRETRIGAGEVLTSEKPGYIPDRILRIISVCLGGGIFAAIGLWDFLCFCRRRAEGI